MKKIQLSIILLLFIGIVSCKKTDDSANVVSTDQIADLASGSLANTTGLSTNFDDMTVNAESLLSINRTTKTFVVGNNGNSLIRQCGSTIIDSLVKTGTSNAVTFSYFLKYTNTLNCGTNNQPSELDYNLAFHGNYDGPNIAAKDTGTSVFTITGFGAGTGVFTMNGTYNRKGAFTSKVGNRISGTSQITIVVTSLTVTQTTGKIASGNATISFVITLPKGTSTYTGSLVFNGDDTATFTLSGAVYTINLITGTKAKH